MNTDYCYSRHVSQAQTVTVKIVDNQWMNSKSDLFTNFQNGRVAHVVDTNGVVHTGVIGCILREDGSNNCWVVNINGRGSIFVKTF